MAYGSQEFVQSIIGSRDSLQVELHDKQDHYLGQGELSIPIAAACILLENARATFMRLDDLRELHPLSRTMPSAYHERSAALDISHFAAALVALRASLVDGVWRNDMYVAAYNSAVCGTSLESTINHADHGVQDMPFGTLLQLSYFHKDDPSFAYLFTTQEGFECLPPVAQRDFGNSDSEEWQSMGIIAHEYAHALGITLPVPTRREPI